MERINLVKSITIHENNNPSTHLYLDLESKSGMGNFNFDQQVQIVISKIIPVYKMDFLFSIKHDSIIGNLQTFGSFQETFEMLEVVEEISKIFLNSGYVQLSDYDLYDTVFEWKELNIQPFDRRLTLDYAVFFDELELCDG